MKFSRRIFRPTTRAITPRRLAAARRWLDREAASLPLFRDQVRTMQPTPEGRIQAADASFEAWKRQFRNFVAKQWREARRILQALRPAERAAVVARWNASPYPKDGAYCLGFVRQRAQGDTPGMPTPSHDHPLPSASITPPHPQSPRSRVPMINGTPYLTLRHPHDPTRTFTYYAHPDGESINVQFQDADGPTTFGPWSLEAGHRHAAHLQQSGYLPINHTEESLAFDEHTRHDHKHGSRGSAAEASPAETCACSLARVWYPPVPRSPRSY